MGVSFCGLTDCRIAGRMVALREDVWRVMHKPIKYVEKGLTFVAKGAWAVFDALNSIKPNESFTRTGPRSRC